MFHVYHRPRRQQRGQALSQERDRRGDEHLGGNGGRRFARSSRRASNSTKLKYVDVVVTMSWPCTHVWNGALTGTSGVDSRKSQSRMRCTAKGANCSVKSDMSHSDVTSDSGQHSTSRCACRLGRCSWTIRSISRMSTSVPVMEGTYACGAMRVTTAHLGRGSGQREQRPPQYSYTIRRHRYK